MILQTSNLTKTYARGDEPVHALRGVSLTIPKGQFASIMGPSGSGKSTLLHLIGGLDRPSTGSVEIDGQAIESFKDSELSAFRRRRLGFIFQFFNLLPTLTALENVALPCLLDGQPLSKVRPRAIDLLSQMGLRARAEHRPDQLSGGEMQRVAIARALVAEPLLILADEPTGNLDSKTGDSVLELLGNLARGRGHTILMVTHDSRAASFSDRLIRLRDGAIESDGAPAPRAEAPRPQPKRQPQPARSDRREPLAEPAL
jgi:putative ABC transport system ATP-binding protein